MQIEMTPEEVTALMAKLSDKARSLNSGFGYDDGVLTVPTEFVAEVKKAMKKG